jgi:hypothetical protein
MRDESEVEPKLGDRRELEARKPWHAPQFIVMSVVETDTQGHGASDNTPFSRQS